MMEQMIAAQVVVKPACPVTAGGRWEEDELRLRKECVCGSKLLWPVPGRKERKKESMLNFNQVRFNGSSGVFHVKK